MTDWKPTTYAPGDPRGLPVVDSPYLDADRWLVTPSVVIRGTRKSPGWEARQIVREGLADVIAWLRERRAGEPTPETKR